MVQIDIQMPSDCYSCWVRKNIGCKIANNSGWLNNKRDDNCPLKEQPEIVRCKDCKFLNVPSNGVPFCKHIKKFVSAYWFCADSERKEGVHE